MSSIEKEVDRILTLLRNKIRERGFTQLEVQEKLNWGRSYISQLLTKQKSLRVEQVLLILETIKVDPKEFYAELYQFGRPDYRLRNLDEYADPQLGESLFGPALVPEGESYSEFYRNYHQLRAMVRGLVQLMVDKDIVSLEEIIAAAKAADPDPDLGPLG
ncbi:MAG TPA: helix-turn-helix transcriptional regulator [Thermoanaerobaculia bacterium]|jgi:transcriptional regulator with XRE-family HTH domain